MTETYFVADDDGLEHAAMRAGRIADQWFGEKDEAIRRERTSMRRSKKEADKRA